jgi:hypothetical protein
MLDFSGNCDSQERPALSRRWIQRGVRDPASRGPGPYSVALTKPIFSPMLHIVASAIALADESRPAAPRPHHGAEAEIRSHRTVPRL